MSQKLGIGALVLGQILPCRSSVAVEALYMAMNDIGAVADCLGSVRSALISLGTLFSSVHLARVLRQDKSLFVQLDRLFSARFKARSCQRFLASTDSLRRDTWFGFW